MTRFRVRYQLATQRVPREDVLDLVGGNHPLDLNYVFSARPIAGTQTIPKTAIIQMLPTSDDTPITLGRIYRP